MIDYTFDGADYVPERDDERLGKQCQRIFALMKDGLWRSLPDIEQITGDPQPSISAQLRHFRKPRFGAHIVERRRGDNSLYEYRLLPASEELVVGKKETPVDTWVSLDDSEIIGMTCECIDQDNDEVFTMECAILFARSIEKKIKELNSDQ
jgi:hypothetical protein